MKRYQVNILVFLLSILLSSCDNQKANVEVSKQKGEVLAHVNDEPIYQRDLERILGNKLERLGIQSADPKLQKKMLESIVLNKAMSIKQRKKMNEHQINLIADKVKDFEEQLLVKDYLADYMAQGDVLEVKLKAYYDNNKERFGEKQVRKYEAIHIKLNPNDNKERLFDVLNGAKSKQDWQAYVNKNNSSTVKYVSAAVDSAKRKEKLEKIVFNLKQGSVSDIQMINGTAYVFRLLDSKMVEAQPYKLVKKKILQEMKPMLMREAINLASVDALSGIKVNYKK